MRLEAKVHYPRREGGGAQVLREAGKILSSAVAELWSFRVT
jgi:hypothetical protein